MENREPTPADDLLIGTQAISDFTGFTLRQTRRLIADGTLPSRKMGRLRIGSKRRISAVMAHLLFGDES